MGGSFTQEARLELEERNRSRLEPMQRQQALGAGDRIEGGGARRSSSSLFESKGTAIFVIIVAITFSTFSSQFDQLKEHSLRVASLELRIRCLVTIVLRFCSCTLIMMDQRAASGKTSFPKLHAFVSKPRALVAYTTVASGFAHLMYLASIEKHFLSYVVSVVLSTVLFVITYKYTPGNRWACRGAIGTVGLIGSFVIYAALKFTCGKGSQNGGFGTESKSWGFFSDLLLLMVAVLMEDHLYRNSRFLGLLMTCRIKEWRYFTISFVYKATLAVHTRIFIHN